MIRRVKFSAALLEKLPVGQVSSPVTNAICRLTFARIITIVIT
jgi:hypothetical protein